jgi:hypothetical protein
MLKTRIRARDIRFAMYITVLKVKLKRVKSQIGILKATVAVF